MISVIVVTYNRKTLLKQCIESLLNQEIADKLEVIVIDNYSSDRTEDLFKNGTNDRIKFIRNHSRKSLWEAKNIGIKMAKGDIVAFTDDDCTVPENWLAQIQESLNNFDFVGGATYPSPDIKFPWWWKESMEWLLGINTNPRKNFLPLGNNVAFRKYVLEKILKDNQTLCPKIYLPYGEDNYRLEQALYNNFTMMTKQNLVVFHQFTLKRLTFSYLIKRSYQEGKALVSYKRGPDSLIYFLIKSPYNFVKFFIHMDINSFFRSISNISYIFFYLKNSLVNPK